MTTRTSSPVVKSFLGWLQGALVGPLLSLRVDAEPAPESLRIGMGRVFPGKLYGIFYADCQKQLSLQRIAEKILGGPIAAVYEFVHERPKKPANPYPVADWDNLAKGPQDAVTKVGGIWEDDKHVVQGHVFKRYAQPGETPGVNIFIGKLKEAL